MSERDQADADPPPGVGKKVLVRLTALDRAMKDLGAFCALLKDLHARDLSAVREPHAYAISVVRAGILRGAIGTVMACLERLGGDRASVGEILGLLEGMEALQQVRESHECEFRFNPATHTDLKPATVPI